MTSISNLCIKIITFLSSFNKSIITNWLTRTWNAYPTNFLLTNIWASIIRTFIRIITFFWSNSYSISTVCIADWRFSWAFISNLNETIKASVGTIHVVIITFFIAMYNPIRTCWNTYLILNFIIVFTLCTNPSLLCKIITQTFSTIL